MHYVAQELKATGAIYCNGGCLHCSFRKSSALVVVEAKTIRSGRCLRMTMTRWRMLKDLIQQA